MRLSCGQRYEAKWTALGAGALGFAMFQILAIGVQLVASGTDTQAAIKELRQRYPSVPSEGANGEQSTYLHLLVCYLEWGADERLMGELAARQVIEFWSTDHYQWVYTTLLHDRRDIREVLAKHNLFPTGGR